MKCVVHKFKSGREAKKKRTRAHIHRKNGENWDQADGTEGSYKPQNKKECTNQVIEPVKESQLNWTEPKYIINTLKLHTQNALHRKTERKNERMEEKTNHLNVVSCSNQHLQDKVSSINGFFSSSQAFAINCISGFTFFFLSLSFRDFVLFYVSFAFAMFDSVTSIQTGGYKGKRYRGSHLLAWCCIMCFSVRRLLLFYLFMFCCPCWISFFLLSCMVCNHHTVSSFFLLLFFYPIHNHNSKYYYYVQKKKNEENLFNDVIPTSFNIQRFVLLKCTNF